MNLFMLTPPPPKLFDFVLLFELGRDDRVLCSLLFAELSFDWGGDGNNGTGTDGFGFDLRKEGIFLLLLPGEEDLGAVVSFFVLFSGLGIVF